MTDLLTALDGEPLAYGADRTPCHCGVDQPIAATTGEVGVVEPAALAADAVVGCLVDERARRDAAGEEDVAADDAVGADGDVIAVRGQRDGAPVRAESLPGAPRHPATLTELVAPWRVAELPLAPEMTMYGKWAN